MSQGRDAAIKPGKVPLQGLTCHFSLKDLVRVDFVFPYGRIAATRIGVRPEPFDRDAESEFDHLGMEEIRDRIADLFK